MCFEDLNLDGMKRLWGRKISDLALDSFMRKVSYLAAKYGKHVVEIPRFYPSSKTCSCCGHVKQELSIKDRIFVCEVCNLVIDRDYNASQNVKRVGTSTFVGESGKDFLREAALDNSRISRALARRVCQKERCTVLQVKPIF